MTPTDMGDTALMIAESYRYLRKRFGPEEARKLMLSMADYVEAMMSAEESKAKGE